MSDNITFTASADSTPPANTVVATKQFGGGEHAQEIILADVDENFFSASGFGASPIVTIVSNLLSVSIGSGSVTVDKINSQISASVSGGSVALLAGANVFGSASVIQSTPTGIGNAWPVKITDGVDIVGINSSSQLLVAIAAASVNIVDTAGNQYGISAASPMYVTGGAGGTNIADAGAFAEGVTSLTPAGGVYLETTASLTASQVGMFRITASRALHVNLRDASGLQLGVTGSPIVATIISGTVNTISNQVSASVSSGSITVDKVNLQVSASVSGGSVALLAGANNIGIASVIQQVTSGWSLSSIYNQVSASISAGSITVDKIDDRVSASISGGSITIDKVNLQVSASVSGGSLAILAGVNAIGVASVIQQVTGGWSLSSIYNVVSASIGSGSLGAIEKVNTPVSASISSGSITVDKINLGVSASISNAPSALISGDLAHDAADAGNPVKVGIRSASFGVKPTAVAHADRSNWYGNVDGIPFILGGHMAASSKEFAFTTAQNDQALWAASTTNKLVITKAEVTLDEAVTVGVGVRLGFGTNTLSASGTGGASGLVLSHPGLVPGGGITVGDGNGILGAGLNNEAIRFTCEVPTTGAVVVRVTCFEIVA